MLEEIQITKLVHGGQGLGQLSDGRKIFVWNALPGEVVGVRVGRKKRDYAEGFAEEVLTASKDRIVPMDEAYLSTSPWQIMKFEAENRYKKEIIVETFQREGLVLPEFEFITEGEPLHYRNKMEYSFWGDDDGLHLALFQRASHGKRIVTGSSIARPEIDETANKIIAILNKNGVRASSLKTIVLRSDSQGNVVVSLFVKDGTFQEISELKDICTGITVVYSNPKSPASVVTETLYSYGSLVLRDKVLDTNISYGVHSFFQVNLSVFETALTAIHSAVAGRKHIVDMYAGVGTIGLAVGAETLVEPDGNNTEMAKLNAGKKAKVIQASTEQALEYITSDATMIFDPPRAGLHQRVIEKLREAQPTRVAYLSCNPATQARDMARLADCYEIEHFYGYNFFPRTPHIETLVILKKSV